MNDMLLLLPLGFFASVVGLVVYCWWVANEEKIKYLEEKLRK